MFNFLSTPVGVGVLVTATISALCLIWGSLSAEQPPGHARKRFRTLPLMILVAAGCSSLFLIFFALAFGSSEFLASPSSPDIKAQESSGATPAAGLRIAPITVAAGLFGGVLFIAFTVLKYRSHVQADEKLRIEQRASQLETADHFSGRFAQAAEMMGSERAATRMGGVYALAALADEWEENRQQCVDLLCGYLRTPMQRSLPTSSSQQASAQKIELPPPASIPRFMVPEPAEQSTPTLGLVQKYRQARADLASQYKRAAVDELAIRRAVLSSIARGTKRPLEDKSSWSKMSFDFGECFLPSVDLADCQFLERVNFNAVTFISSVDMRRAHFAQQAQFTGCYFNHNATFTGVTFAKGVSFRAAQFNLNADFTGASFGGAMLFAHVEFKKDPAFSRASLARRTGRPFKSQLLANWHGATFAESKSACPDLDNSIWKLFSIVQRDCRIICEQPHPDRPLGIPHEAPL
ncbi:hypothetical protein Achl_1073 [Pseudarthrobacter chlorophenolicus A6]|uniref:Pentapeptide repeat protein n=1 Tax=Pseudarthrobacter chlorophenolicus (strain ATCC 700700 / DSM 12829 / CIP 107037 / JCM 12360 / KCTC 9906 / NCIMB 13794 / A6) TaxID=452863 RepID=B8HE32_PSECP|nr:pentapeptide repeat-containing protein [Pseudarthrobacter chlorophenolicus]ACL39067.1 hypothetical protein Achl_1073 [Pseudarthrobacter chlorophenolicus A6]SDR04857.1 Pentapeptide repeat-containing protein [Pseudarthrobacter chlorophenolicus]